MCTDLLSLCRRTIPACQEVLLIPFTIQARCQKELKLSLSSPIIRLVSIIESPLTEGTEFFGLKLTQMNRKGLFSRCDLKFPFATNLSEGKLYFLLRKFFIQEVLMSSQLVLV